MLSHPVSDHSSSSGADRPLSQQIQALQRQAASLLLYQAVLQNQAGQAFLALLRSLHSASEGAGEDADQPIACLSAYGQWFHALASVNMSWQDWLVQQILTDDNPFSRQAQGTDFVNLPAPLVAAAQQDLRSLQALYLRGEYLSQWVQTVAELAIAPVSWESGQVNEVTTVATSPIAQRCQTAQDWGDLVEPIAAQYAAGGVGLLARYQAFRWRSEQLQGVAYPDAIGLEMLAGYETQKAVLMQNTEALLAGYAALHVLLYGSRGSGKSSLVKALVGRYGQRGLRLVEVGKADMYQLPTIVDYLRAAPQKFIIFVDDLSFEEDDDAYKALKVVLEGSITARPQNVVVYATSNRRHLIREFHADRPRPRDADEIHTWDTVQEKLSFSDRFGLTLTFEPANQDRYLEIVHHLAQQSQLSIAPADLEYQALQWATRHNGRSGRTARQFIDFVSFQINNK